MNQVASAFSVKLKITVLTEFSGSMASTLVKGDNESDAVEAELRTAIDEFQATLSHLGHTVGFRTFELVTGTPVLESENFYILCFRASETFFCY